MCKKAAVIALSLIGFSTETLEVASAGEVYQENPARPDGAVVSENNGRAEIAVEFGTGDKDTIVYTPTKDLRVGASNKSPTGAHTDSPVETNMSIEGGPQ